MVVKQMVKGDKKERKHDIRCEKAITEKHRCQCSCEGEFHGISNPLNRDKTHKNQEDEETDG